MRTVFSTYDIRGRLDESLTVEDAWTVGKAFAEWLQEDGVIVIGKESAGNETIRHAVVEGLLLQGRDLADAGEADQQKMTETIGEVEAVGGVLIGHDGVQDLETITLYDNRGVPITADAGLTAIEELIEAGNFIPAAEKGEIKPAPSV